MNQTMLSKEVSPLFDAAVSKLRPGVFSHPVWIRFGRKEKPVSPRTIEALFSEAEELKQHNPSDACQVLLVCAVFQHYSGQTERALATIQTVRTLAERNRLDQEILWALWGACAICVQDKNFDKATTYLISLKHSLSEHDDWVLAGFVDVVRQSLAQGIYTTEHLPIKHQPDQSFGDVLVRTFRWLNQWGFSAHKQDVAAKTNEKRERAGLPRFSFSGWKSLRLLFKGELKVNWLDDSPEQGKRRSTFWGYLLSLFHIEATSPGQEIMDGDVMPSEVFVAHPPETITPSNVQESKPREVPPVSISVQMLGNFSLTIQEITLNLPSSRSLSLLKYLLLHHRQFASREMLLDTFWPDVSPEKGRNNLNVAMNGIRTSLRTVTDDRVILYKDNAYGIAPEIQFWVDVEEFERLVDSGGQLEARNKLTSAISDYEAAVSLYQGDFLEENPYENWTVLPREQLRLAYLGTLDRLSSIYFKQGRYAMCITLSQLILARDRCREDAHSMLMRCYSRQGQDHLALRQYQVCVEALRLELDVTPAPETMHLYELIRQHKQV